MKQIRWHWCVCAVTEWTKCVFLWGKESLLSRVRRYKLSSAFKGNTGFGLLFWHRRDGVSLSWIQFARLAKVTRPHYTHSMKDELRRFLCSLVGLMCVSCDVMRPLQVVDNTADVCSPSRHLFFFFNHPDLWNKRPAKRITGLFPHPSETQRDELPPTVNTCLVNCSKNKILKNMGELQENDALLIPFLWAQIL